MAGKAFVQRPDFRFLVQRIVVQMKAQLAALTFDVAIDEFLYHRFRCLHILHSQ